MILLAFFPQVSQESKQVRILFFSYFIVETYSCLLVGSTVAASTHQWFTELQMKEMRQILLGLVCCNTEVFRVWTKHTLPHSPPV